MLRQTRPEQAPNRNLSTTTSDRLVGLKENASDAILLKTVDSPITRPVSPESPIITPRLKTFLENDRGYDNGVSRRERGKAHLSK